MPSQRHTVMRSPKNATPAISESSKDRFTISVVCPIGPTDSDLVISVMVLRKIIP